MNDDIHNQLKFPDCSKEKEEHAMSKQRNANLYIPDGLLGNPLPTATINIAVFSIFFFSFQLFKLKRSI